MVTNHFRYKPAKRVLTALCLVVLLALPACSTLSLRSLESIPTVDPDATDETKALFINLWTLARTNHTLFGHQDDTAMGVGWRAVAGRSDVLEVAGSYPAVYGWEIGRIGQGTETNTDGVRFDNIRRWIIESYQRGGVNTISWHMYNPVTGGNFYDLSGSAAFRILPGLSHHSEYLTYLDRVADFLLSLRSGPTAWNPGEHLVPVIFRPFHEHNAGQFWWGGSNSTPEAYRLLWQFTVEYLRDERGVHNLLYAISPDARVMPRNSFSSGLFTDAGSFSDAYFYGYPGDDYVDIFGLDNYEDARRPSRRPGFEEAMKLLTNLAHNRSDLKIPALTETGVDGVPDVYWWTTYLLRSIRGARTSNGQVAWALIWRNWDAENHMGPYPGHPSAGDFVEFADSPFILMEDEIGVDLYQWPPE